MNPQTFKVDKASLWFTSGRERGQLQREIPIRSEELLLGRRLSPNPRADASPVYQLRCRTDNPTDDPRIDVHVTIERFVDPEHKEELLRIKDVRGTVKGRPAEKDVNVRLKMLTLAHERYYLDMGALDNIAEP